MSQDKERIESPELEHIAALALNGLLSNPAVIKEASQVREEGLKALAGIAFRSAYFLQQRLHQERNK